jgi:hypothetical protein
LDGTNLPSATINLNSNKITNLANPTNNTDAVNKEYVDENKVAKSGDIMTGDLIIKTGTDSFKTLGCDDLFSNANTFNLLMGNSQNKITYNAGHIIINASSGFAVNQNGVDVMSIGKEIGDPRIGVFQDVLVNQNFISDVKDPILDKDAVTKIYSDSIRYMTATPTLNDEVTVINGLPYRVIASSFFIADAPYKAFTNTFNLTGWKSIFLANSWIIVFFPYPISMRGFSIIPSNNTNIINWKIQASNLSPYVDITPTSTTTLEASKLYTFNFTPSAEYSRWRFQIDAASPESGIGLLKWIPTNPDLSLKKCQTGHVPILNTNVGYRGFIPLASSEFSASYRACNVFKQEYGLSGVDTIWASQGQIANFWIQIKCPVPVRIWKTGLTGRNNGTERIFNWRIEASNDGINYVILYTALNPTYLTSLSYQEFEIDSIGIFPFYRLFIINAEGPNPGLRTWQLFVYD